jgi:DNA primase
MHLGYHLTDNYYVCWRCGWKATNKAIALLLRITEQEAKEIARKYGGKSYVKSTTTVRVGQKKFRLPPSTAPMNDRHKRYLVKRNFDPEVIERLWDVRGTGPISIMDNISFSHRLVIPIYWENRIVSFQTRDITAKHFLRYISCPEQREIVKHKHIFYQAIPIKDEKACICVEGVTDAWRFGYGAIATFGIKYTKHQVREISKRFKRVFVVFDDDPQAVKQSEKLAAELVLRGVDAYSIRIQGDPGDMSQSDADTLKKELLGYV